MDHNPVNGSVDEVEGVAQQKTAELTGSTQLKMDGIVRQAKGKLEGARGQAKDGDRNVNLQDTLPPISHE